MFDLSELSEWDKAEQAVPKVSVTLPETRSPRTLQRVIERDDSAQCPFGFTKEPRDG